MPGRGGWARVRPSDGRPDVTRAGQPGGQEDQEGRPGEEGEPRGVEANGPSAPEGLADEAIQQFGKRLAGTGSASWHGGP